MLTLPEYRGPRSVMFRSVSGWVGDTPVSGASPGSGRRNNKNSNRSETYNGEDTVPSNSGDGGDRGNEGRQLRSRESSTSSTTKDSSKNRTVEQKKSITTSEIGEKFIQVVLERVRTEETDEGDRSGSRDDFTTPSPAQGDDKVEESTGNHISRIDKTTSGSALRHVPYKSYKRKGGNSLASPAQKAAKETVSPAPSGKSPSPAPSTYGTAANTDAEDTEVMDESENSNMEGITDSEVEGETVGGDKETPEGTSIRTDGRGRRPTTGNYREYAAAKSEYARAERDELHAQTERELMESWTEKRGTRSMKLLLGENPEQEGEDKRGLSELTAKEIVAELDKATADVLTIASFKKDYKGTSQRILREIAAVVNIASRELGRRTQSDECRRLEEKNKELKTELNALRQEVSVIKGMLD